MGHRHHYRHGHHNDLAEKAGCLALMVAIIGFYFALFGWPAFLIGAWLASSKKYMSETWVIPVVCAVLIAATYPLMNWWIISDPKDGVDEGQWIFVILGHIGGFLWGVFKPMDTWGGSVAQQAGPPAQVGMKKTTPSSPSRTAPNQPRPWGTRTKEQQAERAAAEAQRSHPLTPSPTKPSPGKPRSAPQLPPQVTAYRGFQGVAPPSPTRPFQAPLPREDSQN